MLSSRPGEWRGEQWSIISNRPGEWRGESNGVL